MADRQQRYRDRHKDDPEYRARNREKTRLFREKHQGEPISVEQRERLRSAVRRFRARNLEKVKEWDRKQRQKQRLLNPDKLRAQARVRYARRRAEIRRRDNARRQSETYRAAAVERTKAWVKAHPEHARRQGRIRDSRRRARELEAFVESVDPVVVFARDGGRCGICRLEVDVKSQWHVDHIIPISKGGTECYANVQLAHGWCNRRKAASLPKAS